MINKQCHFIGIGGIGMSGLARLLLARGTAVSGSDLSSNPSIDALVAGGAQVSIGHSAQHIPEGATVIYTTGIGSTNPEFSAAKALGLQMLHRSDLLAAVIAGYQSIAVAGMHGKTTTSALMAWMLEVAGRDPSFAIGGVLASFQSNARQGKGEYFVIEACESDGTFLKYKPEAAIITNIDFEHMDYFGSEEQILNEFTAFVSSVRNREKLFWCGDDSRLRSLSLPGVSYGFEADCALRLSNWRQSGWQQQFNIDFCGRNYSNIMLALPGHHNALNAAAVFGMGLKLGIAESLLRSALASFKGVSRRFEHKGCEAGVSVIDDYAHHPVEIKTTLTAIRKAIGPARLIAVYQPHRYTRTRDCLGMYEGVFDAVDELLIPEIYAAAEPPLSAVNDATVLADIAGSNRVDVEHVSRSNLIPTLLKRLRPHDVVVTLGAGDITELGGQLLQQLKEHPVRKLKVGVIFGGRSAEHEISLMSARNILSGISDELYDVEYIAIAKSGHWISGVSAQEYLENKRELTSSSDSEIIPSDMLGLLQACDVVFPVLHGPYGEDGSIQGLFEVLDLAYVGAAHRAAAICMDKALTKALMQSCGVPTLDFLSFNRQDWKTKRTELEPQIKTQFKLPFFVKATHLGSSFGITRVSSFDDLDAAVECAFAVDTDLLIEPAVEGREIEFAVLGNANPEVFPPGEVLANGKTYDYSSKYEAAHLIPVQPVAELSSAACEEGRALALAAFRAVGGHGMARVDFFFDAEARWWLNEINPIPGFTSNSLFPLVCEAHGVTLPLLIDRLIMLAMQRKRQTRICV